MSETKNLTASGTEKVFNGAAVFVAVVLTIFHLLAASPFLTLNNTTQAVIHGALIVTFYYNIFGQGRRAASPASFPSRA